MKLIEDALTEVEVKAISTVMEADTVRFDFLVDMSGLNRRTDFKNSDLRDLNLCSSDLRGFDFSGSDLRGCWRNSETLIDQTTILQDCLIDWIEADGSPIVYRMQRVESATSSASRASAISELIIQHGRTPHVVKFLVFAAAKSDSIDEFLDFAREIPKRISDEYVALLRNTATRLLEKRLSTSKSRSARGRPSSQTIDVIVNRLDAPRDTVVGQIFELLSEIVGERTETTILRSSATVTSADLLKAVASLGRRK